jgi:hypothetical protein
MKGRFLAAVLIAGAFFAACKKKPPENVPVPKAETAAAEPAVPAAPAVNQNPLTAPGNYLKTTVGQVQKAKDAKALYEQSAKQNIQSLDLDDTGGN